MSCVEVRRKPAGSSPSTTQVLESQLRLSGLVTSTHTPGTNSVAQIITLKQLTNELFCWTFRVFLFFFTQAKYCKIEAMLVSILSLGHSPEIRNKERVTSAGRQARGFEDFCL